MFNVVLFFFYLKESLIREDEKVVVRKIDFWL